MIKRFFDHGVAGELQYFTLPHLIPILLLVITVILIYKYQDKIRAYKKEDNIRLVLAFTLIIADMSYFWHKMYIGAEIRNHLPITVCGWSAILGGFMLLSKKQALFDIVYFWVLAGSINALITPAVITDNGPTHFRYYQFWIEHIGIFIAVFYMLFVHKFKVNLKSLIRASIAILVMGAVAIYVNSNIEGANYLFLSSTEAGESVLDFLPSNIFLRLGIMSTILFTMFALAYIPWIYLNKKESLS